MGFVLALIEFAADELKLISSSRLTDSSKRSSRPRLTSSKLIIEHAAEELKTDRGRGKVSRLEPAFSIIEVEADELKADHRAAAVELKTDRGLDLAAEEFKADH